MKAKLYLFAVLLASIAFIGCKQVKKLTQFDMKFSQTFTLPKSTPLLNSIPLPLSMQTNYRQRLSQYNVNEKYVEKVNLKSLTLNIQTPENGDFSFLKSVKVYVSAAGQPEELIAWKNEVPNPHEKKLILDVNSSIDLKKYILQDEVTLTTTVTTGKLINEDYTIETNAVFLVDALVLGL